MKIVCVTSGVYPIGATFLEWSIQYLSGATEYYNTEQQRWIPLVNNPLEPTSAHRHLKNHPRDVNSVYQCLERFNQADPAKLYSFYPCSADFNYWMEHQQLDSGALTQHDWDTLNKLRQQDLDTLAKICETHCSDIVHLYTDPAWALYFLLPRHLAKWLIDHNRDPEDQLADHGMANVYRQEFDRWDLREQLALDIRPFNAVGVQFSVDRRLRHFQAHCNDLWFDGANLMQQLLPWLKLTIDPSRWQHWLLVYHRWQAIQLKNLRFVWQLPYIVDDIINNNYRPLPKLPLMHEAGILHCLLYLHNKNIQSWQLTEFPDNTQKLYQLLEDNQHVLNPHYQDVLRTSIDSLRSSIINLSQAR